MATVQRYSVQQPQVSSLLTYITQGEIAIPEIQRPFVWEPVKVRNLLDSLYRGYPVGFLITWKNPDIKLKDGSTAYGKRILIDGQQRVTALMAAILGKEVINKDYRKGPITIAFHPAREAFEVANPAIRKDGSWIADIASVFDPDASQSEIVSGYCAKNPGITPKDVEKRIEALKGIVNNQIGMIELAHDLDIDTVTEIFIRVNSEGKPLGQADFVMSKIAVNESYGGNALRKAIDYFSHMARDPDFYNTATKDQGFVGSKYANQMSWLRNENEDLYDPSYTDVLRVAFTSEFGRGKLSDLVALLSGRNFATKQYEEPIVEESFRRLGEGVMRFMNETNYKRLLMILRSAGFINSSMITSANAVNFAYIVYLIMRDKGCASGDIERTVRRWFVMSMLTGRHSGSLETQFEADARRFLDHDPVKVAEQVFRGELSDAFWTVTLPQLLETSRASAVQFQLFKAAQIRMNDKGFLSRDITVRDLVQVKSDVHHIFPRHFLKSHGLAQSQYNQIANFVITQSEINIQVGNKEPAVYFHQLEEQVSGGPKLYGNIDNPDELVANYEMNCIPHDTINMGINDYQTFLRTRRHLMAEKIRCYFEAL
jgi:hypothetical protein